MKIAQSYAEPLRQLFEGLGYYCACLHRKTSVHWFACVLHKESPETE